MTDDNKKNAEQRARDEKEFENAKEVRHAPSEKKRDEDLTDLERQQLASAGQHAYQHDHLDQPGDKPLMPHQRPLESTALGTVGPGRGTVSSHPGGDGLIGDDWQPNPPGVAEPNNEPVVEERERHAQPVDQSAGAAGDGLVGRGGEIAATGPGAAIPGSSGRVIGGGRPNRAFHASHDEAARKREADEAARRREGVDLAKKPA